MKSILIFLGATLAVAPARAEGEPLSYRPASVQPVQPEPAGGAGTDAPPPPAVATFQWGQTGSRWWTFGATYAKDSSDATDVNVHAAYSYFIQDDVEWALEAAVWNIALQGGDAQALNASMIFRWHFFNNQTWSAYIDAGIGVMVSNDDVPNDGTSLNFTPRAGAGITRRLTEGGARLQFGVRWAHISNARLESDSHNPSRDSLAFYAGLVFPF